MKLSSILSIALGLAFSTIAAYAQLNVNLHERGTFGPFIGGTNSSVTPNGVLDASETIRTGTPVATPFNIVYTPTSLGASVVTLGTGTLTTATFQFNSPITPLSYFTTVGTVIEYDFDNDGIIDLTQGYTINLSPFTAPNGLTGISYRIISGNYFGTVVINGETYSYASVVANEAGTLFNGVSTTSAIQFQFLANPVPEPSTYAVVGVMALGGIVWLRRRKPAQVI